MSRRSSIHIVVFGVLAVMGFISYVLLKPPIYRASSAPAVPDTIRLHGTVRDFKPSHPDFDVVPDQGSGHYAGNIGVALGDFGRPVFVGNSGGPPAPPPGPRQFGFESVFPQTQEKVEKTQIATRVVLPFDANVLSITAYVGMNDKDVRYALYADDRGNPGSLIVETSTDESSKSSMEWLTLGVPETTLTAGTYWLALAFEEKKQRYAYELGGGATRRRSQEATKNGFLDDWGTSDESSTERVSIYATVATTAAPVGPDGGFKVLQQWVDAQSHPIAPHLFGVGIGSDDPIEFDIVDQDVIPMEPFAVQVTVLGAAIQTGSDGYHRPVTAKLHVGTQSFEPFGSFEQAVAGNLNDDQTVTGNANGTNPRLAVIAQVFSPYTPIWVSGRSWKLRNSDLAGTIEGNWEPKMTENTQSNGPQIKVLRDGDPVPDIRGLYEQDSIAEYVADYVNTSTGTMRLGINEIIYLFEVGESGNSSTADFQDLVVVITLASDPSDFPTTPNLCGLPIGDEAGRAGPSSSGGISSADSFDQWYRDVLGTNLSKMHTITLQRNASGVYEYLDDAFHPIDGGLLGDDGMRHNHHFTYSISGTFTYTRCASQFLEFEGSDDAWLFVNRELVMDLGGVTPGTKQFVPMDRLGLEDGTAYPFHFFYAQRQEREATFRLRTNINLANQSTPSIISGSYD